MKAVSPYLNFPGTTEDAFRFYQTVFGGELQIMRFRDFPDNSMGVPDEDLDKVANAALPLGDATVLMGTDTLESLGQEHRPGNNFSITLETDSAEEAVELFRKLSQGGLPLAETEWAEKHGLCTDRFGVQWMFNYAGEKALDEGAGPR